MSDFVTLGDHISIQKGKPPLAIDYVGKQAEPYLNPEYLRGRAQANLAKAGPDAVRAADGNTILLWDGSNAGEFFRAKSGLIASTMAKISPSKAFLSTYFFHVAKHAENYLKAQTSGTGIPHVDRELLEAIRIFCPDINQQQVIAEILDALDTATHETEAIIAKLKAVKQGLLHDLLTRGIDANGELRPPQAEAPHLYKESPLGWIPKEWCASTVAEDFRVDSGLTLGPHRIPRSSGYPYLRVANVHRSRLDLDDVARLEASAAERATKALRVEDLLIVEGHASTEEIGRCALVTDEADGMLFQNHLFRLRANSLAPKFGLLWLNSLFVRSYWRSEAATSSGLNTINRKKLNRLGVAVPPDPEQEEIAACADAADSKLTVEMLTLTKLQQQKSALMDDLLTGRVRVTPLLEAAAP